MQYALQGCTDENAGADCVVYNAFHTTQAKTVRWSTTTTTTQPVFQRLSGLKNYLLFEGEDASSNDRFLIDTSVNGSLFELPGGDAQLAVGYQFHQAFGQVRTRCGYPRG